MVTENLDGDRFLPLKPPIFMILVVLAEEDAHGYELARRIRERSEGMVRLETGPLYRHLNRCWRTVSSWRLMSVTPEIVLMRGDDIIASAHWDGRF